MTYGFVARRNDLRRTGRDLSNFAIRSDRRRGTEETRSELTSALLGNGSGAGGGFDTLSPPRVGRCFIEAIPTTDGSGAGGGFDALSGTRQRLGLNEATVTTDGSGAGGGGGMDVVDGFSFPVAEAYGSSGVVWVVEEGEAVEEEHSEEASEELESRLDLTIDLKDDIEPPNTLDEQLASSIGTSISS